MATRNGTPAARGQSNNQRGALPATPEGVQRRAMELLQRASSLADQDGNILGDPQSRVLDQAHRGLRSAIAELGAPLSDAALAGAVDRLHDAHAQALGASAIEPRTPLGTRASSAAALIDEVTTLLDRPAGFWPEAVEHEAPTPDPQASAAAMPTTAGYTPGQLAQALETICGHAMTARALIDSTTPMVWQHDSELCAPLEAASVLASAIGMLADRACSEKVHGRPETWFYGPGFGAVAGKAVTA